MRERADRSGCRAKLAIHSWMSWAMLVLVMTLWWEDVAYSCGIFVEEHVDVFVILLALENVCCVKVYELLYVQEDD